MVEVIQMYSAILPETTITPDNVPETDWHGLLLSGVSYLYWGGVLALLLRFLVQLSSILLLARKSKVMQIYDTRVHVLDRPAGPFSFFRLIFLHPGSHSDKEIDEILTHEGTHVSQWHSIDVIICELICIVCWVNPFVWLLKREVRHNLEYLADDTVLESGYDSRSYQYHLLGLSHTNKSATSLSNSFNMLHLKNRISMMNKKRSHGIGRAKYLIFIPIVGGLLIFSNIDAVARITDELVESSFAEALMPEAIQLPIQLFPAVNKEEPAEMHRGYVLSKEELAAIKRAEEQVFTVVEKMPEYPGGQKALLKYLASSVKYPESAMRNGVEGRVSCSFIVRKNGSITDAEVIRGVDPALNAEALRIINAMPEWSPGEQRGKAVNVKYTVPVSFRLANKHKASVSGTPVKGIDTSGRIFTVVERMPEFPGGQYSLLKYLSQKIKYPVIAQENGIQGRVSCSFVIGADGALSDVKVIRGVDPSLDAEAVRVIKSMPKWKPGVQNNMAVAVKYTVPVTFRLQ